MNWFKKAYSRGVSRSDLAEHGENFLTDKEKGLINRMDSMGGNERPGYPSDLLPPDQRDDTDFGKIHEMIPGEATLMDNDPELAGEGVNNNQFVSSGESNAGEGYMEDQRMPIGGVSQKLDKGNIGPHNQPHQKGVYRALRNKTKMRGGLNLY